MQTSVLRLLTCGSVDDGKSTLIGRLLVETDSPFLAPMPHRGALNTPAQIANIVRAMAVERNQDLAELATALSDNAERIFGSFAP